MARAKNATVHYRKLMREHAPALPGDTLAGAISRALDRRRADGQTLRNDWHLRLAPPLTEAHHQRLANDIHTDAETAFGNLFAFTEGELQGLIGAARGGPAPSAPVSESMAPRGNEYLKGAAYWLAVGDHCYVVQHSAVRVKAVEEYLTWLLREAGVLGAENSIILQAAFSAENVGGDLGNIQEVEIGGVVARPHRDPAPDVVLQDVRPEDIVEEVPLGRMRAPFERAWEILRNLLGPVEVERLIATVPEEAELRVQVNVSYRTSRRGVDRATLNELATSLRNIDDGEIAVKAKDGRRVGDEVWLQQPMIFQRVNDNGDLLDLEDTRRQLREVHRRFLHDGKIE